MRKRVALLALGLLAVAGPAMADGPNSIGCYFDAGARYNYLMDALPNSWITIYLMATDISAAGGISGWEAEIEFLSLALMWPPTYTLNNGGINVMTAPVFQVGLPEVLLRAPVMKLMTISVWNMGTPFKVAIGPCTPSSFGGLCPGYADGVDPGLLVPLDPAGIGQIGTRPHFEVVAEFMPEVPVDRDSWSGVKGLYR